MKSKHETIREDRLFYCFVDFGREPSQQPKIFIVPSSIVADALQVSHAKWLETPGKSGRVHKDTRMRRFLPDYQRVFGPDDNPYPSGWLEEYKDAWCKLGLAPEAADAS